jgi:hypothetical protein
MKEENRGITFCFHSGFGVCGDLFIGKMCLQGNDLQRNDSQGNVNEELVIYRELYDFSIKTNFTQLFLRIIQMNF